MLRRYLVALVGGGVAYLIGFRFGVVGLFAVGAADILMTQGERLGLVPPSEEIGRPTSIFDDKGKRG
jgi:hypothetical protein